MALRPADFKSAASADFAIRAPFMRAPLGEAANASNFAYPTSLERFQQLPEWGTS